MCGIAGALDLTGRRMFSEDRLLAMTRAIEHRGPDDEHIHIEPGVALGARRLSIVDLAGGRQPLSNEDGSIWTAFNGELFDYPDLRREMLANGHRLSTRCDTEAWVHLYEDHGEGVFERAKGQFAVSLWDRRRRTLFLGRDRVGISPLYYTQRDGWLLWASEVKGLLASGMVPAVPDPRGIDHLFTFFCSGATRSFFEGVTAIAPGHYLKIVDGQIQTRRYWDLDFPDRGIERREANVSVLVDELEARLGYAVERRLRGDVPVVSYISGGLDSTVVLGLCKKMRGEAPPSFTIALENAGPNESAQAREAADALGSQLTMVHVNKPQIAEAFPELTIAAEGPVLDTSCACLMELAKTVHGQGYKCVLTGEGADEALAGYVWFKSKQLLDGIKERIGGRMLGSARSLLLRSISRGQVSNATTEVFGNVRPAQLDLYEMLARSRSLLYSDSFWDQLGGHDPFADLNITNPRFGSWHPLNQSLYVGYKVMLAGLLMVSKGDRIAMHSSVEARYPFLDEDVIEFCASVDPSYKLHGRTEKWLLRQVAARTLPRQIANRPKTMFRAKLAQTFLGPHRPAWVDQLLSPESLKRSGVFDPAKIARERYWQTTLPRMTPRRFVLDLGLTCVVSTQLWRHLYCGGGLCDLPVWEAPSFRRAPAALAS
jgi:asparagine synthase (glutamine-hydrolysing)